MGSSHTYVISARKIDSDGKYTNEPGETRFIRIKNNTGIDEYTQAHEMDKEKWRKHVIAAADGIEDGITGSTGNILIFVHGYNNDIPVVLWRTRKLQETLNKQGWKGLVIAFDWPSANSTLNYLEDRSDASSVAVTLIKDSLGLLTDAQFPPDGKKPCTVNIHMIGHSTGAYVIMEAFSQASKKGEYFKLPWRIAQVVFIGGDVASDSLSLTSDWSNPLYDRILRLTNYSNGFDKVLGVSNMKRLGTAPRAGRIGLPANIPYKSVNVDCSEYFQNKDPNTSSFRGTFNHSWHIGDDVFAADLAMTLEGEIDRNFLPTRKVIDKKLVLQDKATRPAFQQDWDKASNG